MYVPSSIKTPRSSLYSNCCNCQTTTVLNSSSLFQNTVKRIITFARTLFCRGCKQWSSHHVHAVLVEKTQKLWFFHFLLVVMSKNIFVNSSVLCELKFSITKPTKIQYLLYLVHENILYVFLFLFLNGMSDSWKGSFSWTFLCYMYFSFTTFF